MSSTTLVLTGARTNASPSIRRMHICEAKRAIPGFKTWAIEIREHAELAQANSNLIAKGWILNGAQKPKMREMSVKLTGCKYLQDSELIELYVTVNGREYTLFGDYTCL